MHRISASWRVLAVVPGVLLLGAVSAGCTGTAWSEYSGWARGQNPCDPCKSDRADVAAWARGEHPCKPCADPCAKPCAPPCAPPCPPPPCPPPPVSPVVEPTPPAPPPPPPAVEPAPPAPPCPPPPCPPPPCPPPPCPPAPCPPMVGGAPPDFPPEAKPGEAWCKVLIPAVMETVTERVMSVCPSTRRQWIPPIVETKTREVCVQPACWKEIDVPGVFRTETYCCEVEPARVEQRKRAPTCEERAAGKCEIWEDVRVPARTEVRTRRVCVEPPQRKTVYTPALYKTEAVVCEKVPGYWKEEAVAPVYETVTHLVCKSPERWEWRRNMDCVVPGAGAPPPAVEVPVPAPIPEPAPKQ